MAEKILTTEFSEEMLSNVTFLTYAKLMSNEDEMCSLRCDWIICDEFHRAGSQKWGNSVRKLLAMYPDAGVLGLSATNVRYLDHQRDMAEELFDGHIASELTKRRNTWAVCNGYKLNNLRTLFPHSLLPAL